MSIGDRIGERLEALGGRPGGFSQAWLARTIGVSQPSINALIRNPDANSKHLPAIAQALQTSAAYLLGRTDDPSAELPPLPIELTKRLLDVTLIRDLSERFALGGGMVLDEDDAYARDVPFPKAWLGARRRDYRDHFLIRGEGDSMQPTIMDGDDILVDGGQKSIDQQDRIWAVGYAELGMVKRVRKLPRGRLQLNSDNPAVTPLEVAADEVRILGRVVWVGRRV